MASMTWWAKDDPIVLPKGNADHWSKMRVRAEQFVMSRDENGDMRFDRPDSVIDLRETWKQQRRAKSSKGNPMEFEGMVAGNLKGNMPGNYQQPSSQPSRSIPTDVNQRAKEGFKYWYQDRPKPTSFGKYGMGSFKTVLGVGNAPRT